ncbi:TIGR02757 family protein [Dysgonomonas sp. 511]|uniref:TIGR02757 family protein n=1 Tax=Dysgonomonas sp. 511 TaxID=2302930 RepID=UPI0013D3503E|nr:TIGR02757 family protein [Dysgonomonas sp. 511]NDV79358.1 TIGR02757 family protein [Dysgonomonas sp. 511]
MNDKLKDFLDRKVNEYNTSDFIANDPVSIPHSFSAKQDIEIMGFFAAIFAWGQRKTIINKCKELASRMDGTPYEYIKGHGDQDLKHLLGFKHRTFNDTDLLYSVDFLKRHYQEQESLESAFFPRESMSVEEGLNHFQDYFFLHPNAPQRTRKHISSPRQRSACKRLNMYLRWMVRCDDKGVDFGLWKKVLPASLICPLDVHVERTARLLGLLNREKADWAAAVELTGNLRKLDPDDPVKYDFALFGVSIEEKCMIDKL